jgi:hypothetical protein
MAMHTHTHTRIRTRTLRLLRLLERPLVMRVVVVVVLIVVLCRKQLMRHQANRGIQVYHTTHQGHTRTRMCSSSSSM